MATTAVRMIPRSQVEDTISAEEAAGYLGVSASTVYNLIEDGEIKATRIGKKRLVLRRKDVRDYFNSNFLDK